MYIIRVSHENSRYWFISQHTKGVANDVAPPSRQIGPRRCRENVRHQHRSDDVNNGAQYTHTPLPTATSLVPPGRAGVSILAALCGFVIGGPSLPSLPPSPPLPSPQRPRKVLKSGGSCPLPSFPLPSPSLASLPSPPLPSSSLPFPPLPRLLPSL